MRRGAALVGVAVGAALFGEAVLRLGIGLGVEVLRRPGMYADSRADDAYWLLHHRWSEGDGRRRAVRLPDVGRVHPRLGWAPPVEDGNPLGIVRETPYQVRRDPGAVLFYGDSYVASPGPMEAKLPAQLEAMLPGRAVYNYGVAGYGVDQIFLRFQESHAQFPEPIILFGILSMDLDRSVLRLRSGQKPYFALEDGRLELRGVPIDPDPRAFVASSPAPVRSYLLALLRRSWQLARAGGDELETPYRREEKKAINRRILDGVVEEARARGLPLVFVLFFGPRELDGTGWRESFLLEEMDRLGIPYVDTKRVLLRAARRDRVGVERYFRRTDGHLSPLGNREVASALAVFLGRRLGIPAAPAAGGAAGAVPSLPAPAVALCDGTVHVVWARAGDIAYRRCGERGGCERRRLLVAATTEESSPALACDGGTVLVAWEDGRGKSRDIALRRSTDGGATFGPLRFLSRGAADETRPSLAISGATVLVVWEDGRRGGRDIAVRRSTDGGASWCPASRESCPVELLVRGGADETAPAVALDGLDAVVAWVDRRHGVPGLAVRRSADAGASWGRVRLLDRSGTLASGPSVASASGAATVVWASADGSVYRRASRDGASGFGRPASPGLGAAPSLAAGPHGLLAAWAAPAASGWALRLETWSPDGRGETGTGPPAAPGVLSGPACDVDRSLVACAWWSTGDPPRLLVRTGSWSSGAPAILGSPPRVLDGRRQPGLGVP